MKISSISAVDVKKIKAQKYSSNPVNLAINNKQYDANKMFGVYFGKDLVSFKGTDFNQTLKDNYFQLPPGCTPDKFQIDAGKALLAGKDVLVEAPTGTGKTAIAHYAATKNMKEGKTTFYTTPLKALSNQKLNEFRAVYGDENVGILTGDRRENVEAPIIIMTTEVYRNMALSHFYGDENPLMENIGTVIFDEFHYLGDPDRGPVWEESVMYTPEGVQTLELSATIGNPKELEKWIGGLKGNNVSLISIPSEARHVPLQFDMIETQSYEKNEKKIKKAIKRGETVEESPVVSKPKLSDFKKVVESLNSKKQLPAILFVFSRNYSREMLEYFAKEGVDLTTKEEKEQIEKTVDKYTANKYVGADLDVEALKKGYAIHNAGIIPGQKELIEELFQKKLLKVVVATETLAAGINMPAKTVVISSPYKPCDEDTDVGKLLEDDPSVKLEHFGDDDDEDNGVPVRLLTSNEFKQMAGRAGRRGIDTVGYVYTMPTDRTTEQDFLFLEVTQCNPINSNYNPDYAFLSGYYEHNQDGSKLEGIFDKTFYVQGKSTDQKDAKMSELMEISERKTNILLDRGFLVQEGDAVYPTLLGNMASKVRGYDALTLAETINSGVFRGFTPQALAMVAASIAIPSKSNEGAISYETDMSMTFDKAKDGIKNVGQRLTSSITSMLVKFGKTFDSFSSYEEMLEFAQSIEKPQASEEEIKSAMKELSEKRSKMYKITKTTGTYTPEELVNALLNKETVPTKVLETHLDAVEKYKKRINTKSIGQYIGKLRAEHAAIDPSSKGSKAKARLERQQKELEADIKLAVNMQYLEENIADAMADNFQFLKKNPPEQIKLDYGKAENMFLRLTLKDELVAKIKALQHFEDVCSEEDFDATKGWDESRTNQAFKKLLKTSSEVFSTEINNGINALPAKYSKDAAQMLYAWASLNQANTEDSMANWMQLVRMTPEETADEGTIYRNVMQTADLLSQIGEMAQVGIEQTDDSYFTELKQTAMKARELLIKEPVTI
ncbi:DEAD/DEAH box helicase [bacterium]|nr:DEAD/DEAH box helicase [bacterium]